MTRRLALTLALCLTTAQAMAADLRVATWNLGWHLDAREAAAWIQACGQPFAQSASDGRWRPSPQGTQSGWELRWGRDAPIEWDIGTRPPCDVYQAGGKIVPVTEESWAVRQRQIRETLSQRVNADVIAFQEVSGAQAVREVLPDGGAAYEVCSYTGHKVQRLAIAWRRSLGKAAGCEAYWPLSLPQRDAKEQPRPGLALTLEVDGKRLRFLTVHLKSSCVTALDDRSAEGRGQLDGEEPNCVILQAQIPSLEAWIEAQSAGVDGLVVLGDFNRNLAHEAREDARAPVRSMGAPTDPHRPGNKVRNLWREVNDGVPAGSQLVLLDSACPGDAAIQALCEAARTRRLEREETSRLGNSAALGCRNPIGLDHIAASPALKPRDAVKVALGLLGRTSAATPTRPQALLAVSDHCPLVAVISG